MKTRSPVVLSCAVLVLLVASHWPFAFSEAQESAEFYFSKGVVAYSQGSFGDALGYFERAAALNAQDAETQHYLGMTQMQQGNYPAAGESLEKALALDPTRKEIHYDLGVVYFKAENYAQALSKFKDAEQAQPQRAMVYFYEGYINYLMEQYAMVDAPLMKAQELDASLTQSCQFYQAMSLMKTSQYDDAEQAFQAVIDTDPETDLAQASASLKARVAAAKKKAKPWSITSSLSAQFDDNVTLEPDDLPTAVQVSDQEDFRTVFHLSGDYRLFKNQCWSSVGRYTFYQSLHSSLHDYDLTKNEGNLNLTRHGTLGWGGIPTTLGVDVNYAHHMLNAKRYLDTAHFRTTWGLNFTRNNFLQAQWRIQTKDFHFSVINSDSSRDAVNNLVGFNHFWFHGNNTRYFRWGLFYDHDNADGSDWDYDGYRFLAAYYTPICKGINFTIDGEYYYQDYENQDSIFSQERSDREYTWSVSFDRDFGPNLNLALQYLGREHNSNIDAYEYDRNVYMLTLTAYF